MLFNRSIVHILLIVVLIVGSIFLANIIFKNREFSIRNNSKKFNFSWNYNNKELISCLKKISTQKQQPLNKVSLIIEDTILQTPFARIVYEERKQLLKIILYLPNSLLIRKNNVVYTRTVYTNLIFSLMEYYKMQDQESCLYEEYLRTRDSKKQYFNISLK